MNRRTWRVSGVQINTSESIAASTEKAVGYIRHAHEQRADMDWHVAHHRTWAMRIGVTVIAANQPKVLGSLVHCGIVGPDGNYVVRVPNQGEQFFIGDIPA